jgi:hypothetical protein
MLLSLISSDTLTYTHARSLSHSPSIYLTLSQTIHHTTPHHTTLSISLTNSRSSLTHIHTLTLEPHSLSIDKTFQFYPLAEIKSKLGHDHIDMLKMDIEGFEWEILENDILKVNNSSNLSLSLSSYLSCTSLRSF